MNMTRQILLTSIMLLGVTFSQAQTTAITSGGEASGSGGAVSYTVGQVACQTHTGESGSISEGVQQPYEISVVTGIEETNISLLNISAYPNPTTNYLQLKVEIEKLKDLSYQLFDINGKLLQSERLTGNETQINMLTYVSATYFVRVISENQSIKEFKIIKK